MAVRARPKGRPTAAGGQVLCNFQFVGSLRRHPRAAAYEALFVQPERLAKALFCNSYRLAHRRSSRHAHIGRPHRVLRCGDRVLGLGALRH